MHFLATGSCRGHFRSAFGDIRNPRRADTNRAGPYTTALRASTNVEVAHKPTDLRERVYTRKAMVLSGRGAIVG